MAESSISVESFLLLLPPKTSSCHSQSESRSNGSRTIGSTRSEVQQALNLLERIRMWAKTEIGVFMKMGPLPARLDEVTAALVTETVNLRDLAAC
jgi:hypothetical protein